MCWKWREEQGDFFKHAAGVSEGGRKVGAILNAEKSLTHQP